MFSPVSTSGEAAGAVEEFPVRRDGLVARRAGVIGGTKDDLHRGRALLLDGGRPGQQRVHAVRGDEVDEGFGVPDVVTELGPVGIGLQVFVAGAGEEFGADGVQRRHARVATPRQVQRREIEWKAQEIVAQGTDHELVDLVADLRRGTAHELGRRLAAGRREGAGVEEGIDQPHLLCPRRPRIAIDDVAGRVDAIDSVAQQRVTEAEDRVRELGDDGRIYGDVVRLEGIDVRLNQARIILEDQVLILHLGRELRRLEQALAVPFAALDAIGDSLLPAPATGRRRPRRCRPPAG